MSASKSTFGERVIGQEAAAAALAAQKGGSEVFGTRVVGVPEPTTQALARKNSQFGPAVLEGAHETDTKGNPGSISVEELEKVLTANPTFFDSLYEGELGRKEGARTAALEVFLLSEYGIHGQGRSSVIDEINGMLGKTAISAKQLAKDHTARVNEIAAREERQRENALVADAERVRILRQRDENLAFLEEKGSASAKRELAGPPKEEPDHDLSKPGEPILPVGVAGVVQGGGETAKDKTEVATTDISKSEEGKKGATADPDVTDKSVAAPAKPKPSKKKKR